MKKIILYAFTLSVFAFGQVFAQSVAEQNLNSAIQSAENVKQEVTVARKAVNQLVKQLTVLNNPNAPLFEAKIITTSLCSLFCSSPLFKERLGEVGENNSCFSPAF